MQMRKQAATTVLAPIFDNYRRAKLDVGKVVLCYMQTYIAPGRRLRVIGNDKASWVTATLDMTEGRFDLKVEETNASINDRLETLTVMQTTLPTMIQEGMPIPPEFVDLLPMNPDLRDSWKRLIAWQLTKSGALPPPDWQPGQPMPQQPDPGAAEAQAEQQKVEAESAVEIQKANIKAHADTEIARITNEAKLIIAGMQTPPELHADGFMDDYHGAPAPAPAHPAPQHAAPPPHQPQPQSAQPAPAPAKPKARSPRAPK
jgi:hypothetical protein